MTCRADDLLVILCGVWHYRLQLRIGPARSPNLVTTPDGCALKAGTMTHNLTTAHRANTPESARGAQASRTRATDDGARIERILGHKTELLNLTREAILLVDAADAIVFWSSSAEQVYGWKEAEVLGKKSLELLKTELPRPLAQIETILRRELFWDAELKQTTKQGARITVASRWAVWRDTSGRSLGRFQLDSDITRRKRVEQELRILSGHLLTIRDEERRRWARELHDSVGQLLVGVTMNLATLQRQMNGNDPALTECVAESARLTNDALQEIRTISYLLHPPMLDEVGLGSALRWYISGFSQRSQIKVDLDLPDPLDRFPKEIEIAVFRIVQETLSNVHRHSGSATARITIIALPHQLRLKVEDQGKGMLVGSESKEPNIPGVGISGIRERVRQLGGQTQVRSSESGTSVEVFFPLERARAPEAVGG